jgi:oxygen-independent coproporphyrinogen-3 oxidase
MSDKQRSSIDVKFDLLKKYDRPGPRYTSYPTAVEFTEEFSDADYIERLKKADRGADEGLSLYVHLPFCVHKCLFCGCHVVITRKDDVAQKYLGYLHQEADMLAAHLPNRRRLTQFHWGGGTPTHLNLDQIEALFNKITGLFSIDPDAEVAIEVDPRVTTPEQLELLTQLGFNRISLGVQDVNPDVQKAIGRDQTEVQTRETYEHCRRLGQNVNLDLVYGLPMQTAETLTESMDLVLDLRPDRIALYSYAHVPWIRAHQRKIPVETLPAAEAKLRLFCISRELLLDAGYQQIGMDHFALPEDELSLAARERTLHRNFMGYAVKRSSDMVGLGVSAIGDVQGAFAQNEKKLSRYYNALEQNRFPVERGFQLNRDDLIRREVITGLMCNFYLDLRAVERRFEIEFASYFAKELAEMSETDGVVDHGFVTLEPEQIEITELGRLFIRNVCMVFDPYLKSRGGDGPVFSRTV